MINYGQFAPDLYGLDGSSAGEASGVLPGEDAYAPWPQPAIGSLAVAAAVRGAFAARTSTNAIALFVLSATKAYKFAGVATAYTDFTRLAGGNYAVGTDDYWAIVQFGTLIYAFNIADNPQSVDVNSGSNFALVAGSPPKARYAAVIGNQIFLAHTDSSPREIICSGLNSPTSWTAGQKRCSRQTMPDGGDLMGITGSERGGLIFQTEIVRLLTLRADAAVFEDHRIETASGTLSPYSIASQKGVSVYYGIGGWQAISLSGASDDIGKGWLDDWFRETSSVKTRPRAVIGTPDPTKAGRFFFLYASSGNATSTTFDRMLCYDRSLVESEFGPWTHADVSGTYLFPAATTATSLENLGVAGLGYTSMDTLVPQSLDSDVWKGGSPQAALFDSANKLNFFTGSPMAATMQTALFKPVAGPRFYSNGWRPVDDAAAGAGRTSTVDRPQGGETWSAPGTLNAQGIINIRASGQRMRAERTIPAGTSWTGARGIDMDDDLIMEDGGR